MRKKNVKLWNNLTKGLKDFEIKVGWFENSRYDADTPIAGVAAVQNFGATINNPGGQPYIFENGHPVFIPKDIPFSENLPRTKPHTIIIPPRPFWDNAKARIEGEEGLTILNQELLRVFEGKQTLETACHRIGIWGQGVIQEEIKKITTPPLASSTIWQRNHSYASKSNKISSKPLNATGMMIASVQSQVRLKG